MDVAGMERLLDQVVAEALRAGERRVALLWHGGEPLLMGAAFFRAVASAAAARQAGSGVEIEHLVQSNLTLLDRDDALLEALEALLPGRRISTSWDPLPGIRRLLGDEDYDQRFRAGLERLRSRGFEAGLVYVVHRGSLGRAAELYRAWKALGVTGVRCNPVYGAGLARGERDRWITAAEWGAFLIDLHRAWDEDGQSLRVDPIAAWADRFAGRGGRLSCAFSGRCTRTFAGVAADGTVHACGRWLDEGGLPFGRLGEAPLAAILRSPARRALIARPAWLRHGECSACRWFPVCHGGCPVDALLVHGDPLRKTPLCAGRRAYLEAQYGLARPAGGPDAPRTGEDGA
jgi:uncharacterized protein